MVSRIIFSLLLVISSVGRATEVVWLELTPFLTYRDLSTNCKTDGFFRQYIGAEIDGREVKAAVIKAGGLEVFNRGVSLKQTELSSIQFEKDTFDRIWLTGLQLNERLIRWLLENSGGALDGCTPTQPLVTATPDPFQYSFKIESLGAGPKYITSNFGKFSGTRKDGRAYQAGLYFTQKQYKELERP